VTALVANCLNLLVVSGGLAGLGAFRADGRRRGLPTGPVTAAYLVVAFAGQLAVLAVLPVALFIAFTTGQFNAMEAGVSVLFLAYSAVVVVLVVHGIGSRDAVQRAYALPRRLVLLVRRSSSRVVDHRRADDLYDALQLLRRPARGLRLGVHAVCVDATGIVLLWCALRALGLPLGLPVAIVGYAVSLMVSIVGFLPAGLGLVEVSLAAVLVGYGAPVVDAAAAVALFRLFELWLPLAAGALAARSVLRPAT